MSHYHPSAAVRRLPTLSSQHSTYPSSVHMQSVSGSSSSFWRQPAGQSPASQSSVVSHAAPVDATSTFAWEDQAQDSWNVGSSYVQYDPSADYVSPTSSFNSNPDYMSSTIVADTFTSHTGTSTSRTSPTTAHTKTRLEAASWSEDLYHIEPESESEEGPSTPPASPRVKQEEIATDEFVFEMSSSAPAAMMHTMPMTEVPLRATGACKEMRKMMGAFRLDPFAMHNGQRGAAVVTRCYEMEIGPLKEEPQYIEFQLDLVYVVKDDPSIPSRFTGRTPSSSSSPSPAPSLSYPLEEEDRFDSTSQRWSSPAPTTLASHSTSHVADSDVFVPIMTPAQSLWQLNYPESEAASSYSLSPPASLHGTEQSSPHLPPLKSMQASYPSRDSLARVLPPPFSAQRSLQQFGGEFTDYSSSSYWSRKTVSLPVYYTAQRSASNPNAQLLGSILDHIPSTLALRSPQHSAMAMRRARVA